MTVLVVVATMTCLRAVDRSASCHAGTSRGAILPAIAVVVAVIAALTLLPAELSILGPKINSLRVRHQPTQEQIHNGLWARWAREIAKQPILAGLAALARQKRSVVASLESQSATAEKQLGAEHDDRRGADRDEGGEAD